MKSNQDKHVNISILKSLEPTIKDLLTKPEIWQSLDISYYPPRVERLFTIYNGYRIFITDKPCLFHRWPAAFKQISGCYEMGITYSEKEVNSDEAYNLPTLAKFIVNEGSYYEMTQTNCLHYVKPLNEPSCSIMITYDLYEEDRKEIAVKLEGLTNEIKMELLTFAYNKI